MLVKNSKLRALLISVALLSLNSCIWKCNGIDEDDVAGYYYSHLKDRKDCLHLKKDGTFVHYYLTKDTLIIDNDKWDVSKKNCRVYVNKMRWIDNYYRDYQGYGHADFKWIDGELWIGEHYLGFSRSIWKPDWLKEVEKIQN